MEDLTGKQLGQYRIVEALGEGGMATVYKAYQASVDRYVALKILPRQLTKERDFIRRFKQEAKIIAKLEHPNILPVHDYGESDGYTYIVMRYVEGGTLADRLQGTPLPIPKISPILTQIASALDYAHSKGVIHRDIKPSNVLIDEHGNCLLSDFGISRMIETTSHFTASGAFIGTPAYASPEQALSQNLDGRSDIYSLGVVLFEMTTGRPPFEAETPVAILIKHVHDPLPMPSTLNPEISEVVERIILKALAKEPEDRFQEAGEIANELMAVANLELSALEGELLQGSEPSTEFVSPLAESHPQPPPKYRRIPVWSWIVIGLMALFLTVGLFGGGGSLLSLLRGEKGMPTPITSTLPIDTPPTFVAQGTTDTSRIMTPVSPTSSELPIETQSVSIETSAPRKMGLKWTQVNSFPAPGDEPTGLVRVGDHLFVNIPCSNRIYRLDLDGNLTAELEMPKAGCGPRNVGLIWDGTSLWGTWWEAIVKIDPENGQALSEWEAEFQARSIAWDGSLIWVVDRNGNLSAYDQDGQRMRRVGIPVFGLISAIAWVEDEFWMLNGFGDVTRFDADFIELETFSLQVACGISSMHENTTFGLFWDGESLWISDAVKNRIIQCQPEE